MIDSEFFDTYGEEEGVSKQWNGTALERLMGIVVDGVIGAIGGFVGSLVLLLVLVGASRLGAFDFASFSTLADLVGLSLLFPARANLVGFGLFMLFGMIPWPLFFASIGWYLPGERFAIRGLSFGVILWTGFVGAFYQGYVGVTLGAYLLLTLFGHLAYGFSLGAVFDYLSDRPETLV